MWRLRFFYRLLRISTAEFHPEASIKTFGPTVWLENPFVSVIDSIFSSDNVRASDQAVERMSHARIYRSLVEHLFQHSGLKVAERIPPWKGYVARAGVQGDEFLNDLFGYSAQNPFPFRPQALMMGPPSSPCRRENVFFYKQDLRPLSSPQR